MKFKYTYENNFFLPVKSIEFRGWFDRIFEYYDRIQIDKDLYQIICPSVNDEGEIRITEIDGGIKISVVFKSQYGGVWHETLEIKAKDWVQAIKEEEVAKIGDIPHTESDTFENNSKNEDEVNKGINSNINIPKYPLVLSKWKLTWKDIQHDIRSGYSLIDISERLEKKTEKKRKYKPDTLRKIRIAGEAGLLD